MNFDEEYTYIIKLDVMMKNTYRGCLQGLHDHSALDFVSHGKYLTHPVNGYLPNL